MSLHILHHLQSMLQHESAQPLPLLHFLSHLSHLMLVLLLPPQDIFSMGCVIAELWLDGRAFFDLSRLLAYRRREYDPTAALAGVEPDMAELIMHMIQRSPGRYQVDRV
eukprot:GHUV01048082.1.p1 GENE.GHUV01048082.1~~GHUV01048082.1.p1  ORF type:complete len:109 (-),score=8.73 GHUV01048082.1:186-512(-)